MLPKLCEALALVNGADRAEGRSSISYIDYHSPLVHTIARIDGRAAVAGYDHLLACGGRLRWLRHEREALVEWMLAKRGIDSAEDACAQLGIPFLPTDS